MGEGEDSGGGGRGGGQTDMFLVAWTILRILLMKSDLGRGLGGRWTHERISRQGRDTTPMPR